ncbi:T9SS type A sorting domain-containing protein [Ferruginibacter paludis]|uniref:T9SS type A sorting domain-containing protein n=1 Tax=Ferruginibacter paludis TaxID=1310417 RepID=UPI0025B50093|nr:T9SS type A sorting domain-containing protein [Ferruginibacter paludis]MDN3656473.1 T9SS type A sorting domain-containing protein [Ferruginibacter paludis]
MLASYAQMTLTVDSTFGTKGISNVDMGSIYTGYSANVWQIIQNNDGSGSNFLLLNSTMITKRNADGSVDASYGLNGYSDQIQVTSPYGVLQPDGKMVLLGKTPDADLITLVRLTKNGLLDKTFGKDGIINTNLTRVPLFAQSYGTSVNKALAIQNDGKIVVGGGVDNPLAQINDPIANAADFAIMRYTADGIPDSSFNKTGVVTSGFPLIYIKPQKGGDIIFHIQNATVTGLVILSNGKIVATGNAKVDLTACTLAIACINRDGNIDSTFGNNGQQIIASPGQALFNPVVASQKDDKIIVAGGTNYGNYSLFRFNSNGVLDSSFSGTGTRPFNNVSKPPVFIDVQKSGKIILGSYLSNGSNANVAITRLNGDGSNDNAFGNSGLLTTDISTIIPSYLSSSIYLDCLALDDNDNILIGASTIDSTDHTNTLLAKYDSNGNVVAGFGVNGKYTINYNQGNTNFTAAAVQNNGKLITAGKTWNGNYYDIAVVRYNTNGSLDQTFGSNGKVITNVGIVSDVKGVAITPGGKIIVGATADNHFAINRYNADGSLDNNFSSNGKQIVAMHNQDFLRGVSVQPDGKILAYGQSIDSALDIYGYAYPNYASSIVRLNVNGELDNTFNNTGLVLIPSPAVGEPQEVTSAVVQTDGKIVVSGSAWNVNYPSGLQLIRLNVNGNLDTSFGNGGIQTSYFMPATHYFGGQLALQGDGKLLATGYSQGVYENYTQIITARYNVNGSPDTSFGNNGYHTTQFTVDNIIYHPYFLSLSNEGKILSGGASGNLMIVSLLNTDGSLDSTFKQNEVPFSFINLSNSVPESQLFSNGKLYVSGYSQIPGSLGMASRFNLNILGIGAGPLPVQLTVFKAMAQANKTALLQWQTVNEENLSGFAVERSMDGGTFSPIGFVPAKGNSNVKLNYSTIDQTPFTGVNYYRLKLIDIDGKFSYSNVATVRITGDGFSLRTSPNPAKNILFVQTSGSNEAATIIITDLNGKIIQEKKISLNGTTNIQLNISGFAAGIYNLQLLKKSGAETKRFIKE